MFPPCWTFFFFSTLTCYLLSLPVLSTHVSPAQSTSLLSPHSPHPQHTRTPAESLRRMSLLWIVYWSHVEMILFWYVRFNKIYKDSIYLFLLTFLMWVLQNVSYILTLTVIALNRPFWRERLRVNIVYYPTRMCPGWLGCLGGWQASPWVRYILAEDDLDTWWEGWRWHSTPAWAFRKTCRRKRRDRSLESRMLIYGF